MIESPVRDAGRCCICSTTLNNADCLMLIQCVKGSHQEALLDDLVVREDETHAVSLHARLRKHCLRGRVLGQFCYKRIRKR